MIVFAAAIYVSSKLLDILTHPNLEGIMWSDQFVWLAMITIILAVLNWSIEAVKWQILLRKIIPLSFIESIKQVLQGVTTAILTPNRMGSFIGRIASMDKDQRSKGVLLTLLAGLAQFSVSISFGLLGFSWIAVQENWSFSPWILIGILSLILAGWFTFFNPSLLLRTHLTKWLPFKWKKELLWMRQIKLRLKWQIISWSALRFIVFSVQFTCVLLVLSPGVELLQLWLHVCAVYGLMTILPGLFFGKLLVREASALFVLSGLGIADHAILLAGLMIWIVNIGMPALIGASFMLRQKRWFQAAKQ